MTLGIAIVALIGAALALRWAFGGRAGVDGGPPAAAMTTNADTASLLEQASGGAVSFQPAIDQVGSAGKSVNSALMTKLERNIVLAGLPDRWPIERVLTTKWIGLGIGTLLGVGGLLLRPSPIRVLLALGMAGVGYFLTDVAMIRAARLRQEQISRTLPDVLDQVTLCAEAGLSFEAGLARVAETNTSALAVELGRALQDMRLGISRADAMRGIMERTDVRELRVFIRALIQGERTGVPLAGLLRTQAEDARDKRLRGAEEQAMKIPVKIIFPLVACILPAMFMVLLAPAVIQISSLDL